jgi:DnaD/phage-associated family protein
MAADNGDAALLYLCMLAGKDASTLKWQADRLEKAHQALVVMKLADPTEPVKKVPVKKLEDDRPPEYTSQDVTAALKNGGGFAALVPEVEKLLGKVLSPADLKSLLLIHDHLTMPPEVILTLVGWCIEVSERKYGAGRKPTLPLIKREANKWYKAGVLTLDAADTYLQRQQKLGTRGMEIMAILGITGRDPVPQEEAYLHTWIDLEYSDEVIRLAYERTVMKKQALNWPYMNSILKDWHKKGLHTVPEILAGDSDPGRKKPAPVSQQYNRDADEQLRRDMEWLERFSKENQGV